MDREKLIAFLKTRAVVELTAEQDDTPVRGNAMASGDDDEDRQYEDRILERLDRGDVWAWASVKVSATYAGHTGTDYLGACSYKDEADFRGTDEEPGDYYSSMVDQAIEELSDRLLATCEELEALRAELEEGGA